MSTPKLVTVALSDKADGPVRVVVQRILDGGRERHANGSYQIEPGSERHVVVDDEHCIRVEVL